jgi:hypothetical protein
MEKRAKRRHGQQINKHPLVHSASKILYLKKGIKPAYR